MDRNKWRIFTASWNVNMKSPPASDSFLEEIFANLCPAPSEFSLVLIGLQEVNYMPLQYVASVVRGDDLWSLRFRNFLSQLGFVQLTCSRENSPNLLGVVTLLFIRRDLLFSVTQIETKFAKLGYFGYSGHKSAIGIRITLLGNKLTLINCHFEAHQELVKNRLEQYQMALALLNFDEGKTISVGCVVWLGDMNFRVELNSSRALSLIHQSDFAALVKHDQLLQNKLSGKIFQEFSENQITFPPSYKYLNGTSEFDLKRTPSYCDRIWWKSDDSIQAFSAESYWSISSVNSSDHKPVCSVFSLEIRPIEPPCLVKFLFPSKLGDFWYSSQSNLCQYWFPYRSTPNTDEAPVTNPAWLESDWIGVYDEDFKADTAPITWQYVFSSWLADSATTREEKSIPEEAEVLNLLFKPKSLPPSPGVYRLGYYSRAYNCLLAMSERFQVLVEPVELAMEAEEL